MSYFYIKLYPADRPMRPNSKARCWKCYSKILNISHRISSCGSRITCITCVSFFLSRYAGMQTFYIPDPSPLELAGKEIFDECLQPVDNLGISRPKLGIAKPLPEGLSPAFPKLSTPTCAPSVPIKPLKDKVLMRS